MSATVVKSSLQLSEKQAVDGGSISTLPESEALLSVGLFVECLLSGTRQSSALGNETLYRAQDTRHRTTLDKDMFAECQTLGKESARRRAVSGCPKADGRQCLPRAEDWHSAKRLLCRVPNTGHSAKKALPSVFYRHPTNHIFVFYILATKLFVECLQ
jgi:hypothetical protein